MKDFRKIIPDIRYRDSDVSIFINCIMKDGNKSAASKVFYGAMDIIKSVGKDELECFRQAMTAMLLTTEVRSRRVGGSTYSVPTPIAKKRAKILARKWIITSMRSRSEYRSSERLANEILDIVAGKGNAIKKRDTVMKYVESNKAFAHYRF